MSTNFLYDYTPEQLRTFLRIRDSDPQDFKEGEDLFIGKSKSITLTLENGTTTKVRDIVVLGKLTIKSSNLDDKVNKPVLLARDIIFCNGEINNVRIKCGKLEYVSKDTFHKNLLECCLDLFEFQRESNRKMGLRSALI